MDTREKMARSHGRLKLFLKPEEVALLLDALAWVREDLVIAGKHFSQVENGVMKSVLEKIPRDIFERYDEIIETTRGSLLVHSVADCDERESPESRDYLAKIIERRREGSQMLRQLMRFIGLAAQTIPPPAPEAVTETTERREASEPPRRPAPAPRRNEPPSLSFTDFSELIV